jgi:hypothetical protein
MATMIIKHSVNDYATWRSVYDGATDLRAKYGLTGERVLRDPDDDKTLLVLQEFATLEGARSFASDPELKADMDQAGVATMPRIEFFQDTD